MVCRKLLNGPIPTKTTEPAVLLAAERTIRQIIDGLIIHVRHAGLYLQRDPYPPLDISGEHGARQAVLRIVRYAQRLLFACHLDDGNDGAEHFVPGNRHMRRDIGEHMRGMQKVFGVSARRLSCPVGAGAFGVREQFLELRLVDDRARSRYPRRWGLRL